MLTCVAIAFNLGPFTRPADFSLTVPNARNEAPRLAFAQETAIPIPAVAPQARTPIDGLQSAIEVADTNLPSALPVESLPDPEPAPVVELTSSIGQPAASQARAESEEKASLAQSDETDAADADAGKNASIVGVWAPNTGTCSARDFREGALPAVISTDGAWAGETFCMFSSKKQTDTGWNVIAKCSSPKERWTANVRLTLKDNRLTWTSRRGTQAYSRCSPDVLMAAVR
jgi:hypothetical protein